jgi:hypothetical protein
MQSKLRMNMINRTHPRLESAITRRMFLRLSATITATTLARSSFALHAAAPAIDQLNLDIISHNPHAYHSDSPNSVRKGTVFAAEDQLAITSEIIRYIEAWSEAGARTHYDERPVHSHSSLC